jgi:hypothetical protein
MKNLLLICTLLVSGCATALPQHDNFKEWLEEVKLNDGRVIVVTQKKRCEGAYTGGNYAPCIAREAWLTINLPEFSDKPIIWHENLSPRVVNTHGGRLFVVGAFPTRREYKLYGEPQPPYISFVWKEDSWQRIPFEAVPESIYDVNMLMEGIPPKGITFLSITKKESSEVNGDRRIRKSQRRLDPSRKWGN